MRGYIVATKAENEEYRKYRNFFKSCRDKIVPFSAFHVWYCITHYTDSNPDDYCYPRCIDDCYRPVVLIYDDDDVFEDVFEIE